MALIKCPNCSKNVSTRAIKCPHCGVYIHTEETLTTSGNEGDNNKSRNAEVLDHKDVVCDNRPTLKNKVQNEVKDDDVKSTDNVFMYFVWIFLGLVVLFIIFQSAEYFKEKRMQSQTETVVEERTEAEFAEEVEPVDPLQELESEYILAPGKVYSATIDNAGFSGPGSEEWFVNDKNNNTSKISVKLYKDGGASFTFSQMVSVQGWGRNMDFSIEGKWEKGSFSYHDVAYSYLELKCKSAVQPNIYDDVEHSINADYQIIKTFTVQLFVDDDKNIYFSKDEMINHSPSSYFMRVYFK